MLETITIADEFQGAARIGILQIDGLQVHDSPEELKRMLNALAGDLAAKYKDQPPGEIPEVKTNPLDLSSQRFGSNAIPALVGVAAAPCRKGERTVFHQFGRGSGKLLLFENALADRPVRRRQAEAADHMASRSMTVSPTRASAGTG